MDKKRLVTVQLQVKPTAPNAHDQFLTLNLPLSVCRALGSRIRPGGFVCVRRILPSESQPVSATCPWLAHAALEPDALAECEKLQSSESSAATPRKSPAGDQQAASAKREAAAAAASSSKKKKKAARSDDAELDEFFEALKADDAKASGRTPKKGATPVAKLQVHPQTDSSARKQQTAQSAESLTVSATSAATAAFGLADGQQLELCSVPQHRVRFWRSVIISPSTVDGDGRPCEQPLATCTLAPGVARQFLLGHPLSSVERLLRLQFRDSRMYWCRVRCLPHENDSTAAKQSAPRSDLKTADQSSQLVAAALQSWGLVSELTDILFLPANDPIHSLSPTPPELPLDAASSLLAGYDEEVAKFAVLVRQLSASAAIANSTSSNLRCRSALLIGPSGTGKTALVTGLCRLYNIRLVALSYARLVAEGGRRLDSALAAHFTLAVRLQPTATVLLLDDVDTMFPADENSDKDNFALLSTFMQLIDQLSSSSARVLVVACTNRPRQLSALARRGCFDLELAAFDAPTVAQRRTLLAKLCARMPLAADVDVDAISSRCVGFVAADIESLCKAALTVAIRRQPLTTATGTAIHVQQADFLAAVSAVRPSALRTVAEVSSKVRWSDIGGLSEAKRRLEEMVIWPLLHADSFKRLGVQPPKGILLYGPPGTGKTLLAKAVASESRANFIAVSIADLMKSGVGDSEKAIQAVFKRARATSPAVLFFDEIQAVFSSREGGGKVGQKVVVLAATNLPQAIDSALLRRGRFDRLVYCGPPDAEARGQILSAIRGEVKWANEVALDALVKATDGFTGADLRALCERAGLAAAERDLQAEAVTAADFDVALASVSPSVSPQDLSRMLAWASNPVHAAGKAPGASAPSSFASDSKAVSASSSKSDSAAAVSAPAEAPVTPFSFSLNSPFTLGESSSSTAATDSTAAETKPLFRYRPVFSLRDDTDHGKPA